MAGRVFAKARELNAAVNDLVRALADFPDASAVARLESRFAELDDRVDVVMSRDKHRSIFHDHVRSSGLLSNAESTDSPFHRYAFQEHLSLHRKI